MSQSRRHTKTNSDSFSEHQESPVITNVKKGDSVKDIKNLDPLFYHPDKHPVHAALFKRKSAEVEKELKVEEEKQQTANTATVRL